MVESETLMINIVVAIITAIVTAAVTLISQRIYLWWKQRSGFERVIGDKIADALEKVRDTELLASPVEIYDIDNLLAERASAIDFFGDVPYYPAIMASPKKFSQFVDRIGEARSKYERYLNYHIAAYLYGMERYCMYVMAYAGENEIPLDLLGVVLLSDFHGWQKNFDEDIVKLINTPQYKVYSQNGSKWEEEKQQILNSFWQESILYKLINNDKSPEITEAREILFQDTAAEELVNKLR